jgi:hypothetical protein
MMSRYQWVHHNETKLFQVGIWPDGTLWNPNGYPDDTVRTAVLEADERKRIRRSNAAKKAAETRRGRRAKKIYAVAKRIVDGGHYGPRRRCVICGKGLADQQSIERGIGSECWQDVLTILEQSRTTSAVP